MVKRRQLCEFGIEVKKKLVEINKPQSWLIEKVRADTGLFVDNGLLQRVWRGEYKSKKLTNSICKILDIEYPISDEKAG